MKRFLLLCFFLVLGAPQLVYSQGLPQDPSQVVRLNDNTRGISFAVPATNWYIVSNSYRMEAYPVAEGTVSVNISDSYSSKLTADEMYQDEKDFMKESMPGAIFLKENEKLTLAGNIGAVSMSYKDPSSLEFKRIIFFIHRGQRYQMTFTLPEAKIEQYKPDFATIFKSLNFFEPTQPGIEIVHAKLGARASTPSNDKGWLAQADNRALDIIFENPQTYEKEVVITMEFDESITASSLQTAYDQRVSEIKRNLPGGQFLTENQKVQLGAATEALSITYKNPSKMTVHRVMVFQRQGQTQELRVSLFDNVFEKFKPTLTTIIKNIKIE